MEDAAAWVGLPLVFAATGIGVGLLVERALGLRLSSAALLPLGVCTSMSALLGVYELGGHGGVAAVALLAAAVAGAVLARRKLRARLTPGPAAVAGLLVAALYLAPSVLSGHWTWYGYNFLNDTAVQFLLADALEHHGAGVVEGLRSTRGETIRAYVESGYPLGSHAQLATFATVLGSGVDVVYQSYLAMLAMTAAVALTGVARLSGLSPWRAAAAGSGALAASLIYHYALQGSIKEIAAFASLATATLLGLELLRSDRPVRAAVALGIAAAAMVSAFSSAAGPYLVVLAAALIAMAVFARGSAVRARLPAVAAAGAATALVVALPTVASALTFLRVSSSALASDAATSDVGQLQMPLEAIQVAGVWLSENYGLPVGGSLESSLTTDLSWLVVALAVAGAIVFARRRRLGPLLPALATLVTWQVVAPRASDYADAKLLALACPAVVFLALSGALAFSGRLRVVGVAAAVVAGLSVLASAAFAYHGVRLAPVDRMHGLEAAVDAVADRGPSMLDEVEEFAKYYGRRAPQLNIGFEAITVRHASPFGGGYHVDLDGLDQSYVQSYRAIITRIGPGTSRPPANFRRVYGNDWYEAWVKDAGVQVKAHLPVQSTLDAGGIVRCAKVRALARRARPGDRLLAAELPPVVELPVVDAPDRPLGWPPLEAPPGVVEPRTPGVVERTIRVAGGSYDAWLRASTGRTLYADVDGRRIGSVHELNTQGQWLRVGPVTLRAGRHTLRIERPGGNLAPGDGAVSVLGPLALASREPRGFREVPPGQARQLCGERWDWVEVVGR